MQLQTDIVDRARLRQGILFSLFAIFVFSTQDVATKLLVANHSPFQITMMRFWAFAAMTLVIVARSGGIRAAFASKRPVLQILRPIILVADIWCFAFATFYLPLAELQAIILIYPLLVTVIAVPVLGERVGIFRISAVVVGFLGALLIVRPGGLPLGVGVLFAVIAAVSYALYIVLTRKVSATDSTATSMAYVGAVGFLMTTAVGIFFWQTPDARSLMLLVYIMATSCVAHGLLVVALGMAPASLLQPFNYTALPWGILFGYLVFGQMIDPIGLLGAVIIVGAGIVVLLRERVKRVPVAPDPTLPGKQ
ncbi:MAG: DMT family transporter [Methylobacterium mesophilicum]|nr:DMT family transporter [Methylobacterium mesophilicum]